MNLHYFVHGKTGAGGFKRPQSGHLELVFQKKILVFCKIFFFKKKDERLGPWQILQAFSLCEGCCNLF